MSKPLLKLTEKDLTARLKPALLTALKRDAGEFFKAHVNRALATWPEDAGLAAVRLVQLCGRIPSDALVAEIRGKVDPQIAPISQKESVSTESEASAKSADTTLSPP